MTTFVALPQPPTDFSSEFIIDAALSGIQILLSLTSGYPTDEIAIEPAGFAYHRLVLGGTFNGMIIIKIFRTIRNC